MGIEQVILNVIGAERKKMELRAASKTVSDKIRQIAKDSSLQPEEAVGQTIRSIDLFEVYGENPSILIGLDNGKFLRFSARSSYDGDVDIETCYPMDRKEMDKVGVIPKELQEAEAVINAKIEEDKVAEAAKKNAKIYTKRLQEAIKHLGKDAVQGMLEENDE